VKKPTLFVITGATGVGKSDLAQRLAQRLGGEILSCDSIQVYRHMDIGSAKPTSELRARIPHHGIDLADPWEVFDVQRFTAHAQQVVSTMAAKGSPLFIVGGSGFYLKTFYAAVTDGISISIPVRQRVAHLHASAGLPGVLAALDGHNSEPVAIDRANPIRAMRALERCWETGLPHREIVARFSRLAGPFNPFAKYTVLLDASRPALERSLRIRIESMLANGFIDEVRELRRLGFERNPVARRSVGYTQILQYLDGDIREGDLVERILAHTRQLVRKQRTWFRRQIPIDEILCPFSQDPDALADFFTDKVLHRHCDGALPTSGPGPHGAVPVAGFPQ
jgi:tRNA dimethylallyltransferase